MFKVGDKVRLVDAGVVDGKTGTIIRVDDVPDEQFPYIVELNDYDPPALVQLVSLLSGIPGLPACAADLELVTNE